MLKSLFTKNMCDSEISINKNALFALIFCLLVGLFGHSFAINNIILNWDSLSLTDNTLLLVTQGKWFWPVISKITGNFLIPSLQRPLAVFFIAVCAYITVIIFDIKNYFLSGSIGAIWVLFPSLISIFLYPGANSFTLAMLFNMVSCLLLIKYNRWFSSFILCVLGLGIYAAYIGMFITFLIYSLIIMVLDGKDAKNVLILSIKYFLFILFACLSYFIILKIVLKIGNFQLSDYRGINEIDNFNFIKYLKDGILSYLATLKFFGLDYFGGFNILQIILNYGFLICYIILFSIITKFRKLGKSEVILLLLLIIIIPLSVHSIGLLGKKSKTHWIMKYPFVSYYLLLPILINYIKQNHISKIMNSKIFLPLILLLSYHWFGVAQECYFNNLIVTKSINSDCQIMINRITQLDDFDFKTPIYVMGTSNEYSNSPINDNQINSHTGVVPTTDLFFPFEDRVIPYINDFYSYDFIQANEEQIEFIKNSGEIKNMQNFPLKGSIKMVDGIVVVNYGSTK